MGEHKLFIAHPGQPGVDCFQASSTYVSYPQAFEVTLQVPLASPVPGESGNMTG